MKITNNFGLPQPFVNVAKKPSYSKGKAHISATGLLNSPKILSLMKKFDDELEQDVMDMIPQMMGTAFHNMLEQGFDNENIIEQRFFAEIDGWKISGAVDLQVEDKNGLHIKDYKTTSVWAVMNDKPEWEQQLNIYAWLFEQNKKEKVQSLEIVAILKDWSTSEAKRKPDYPQNRAVMVPIRLWSTEEQEKFIKDRIAKHSACEFAMETGSQLPDCTPEEMWEKPAVWALIKQGNTRAKSLHDSPASAEEAKKEAGSGYDIQIRQGERTRCKDYCLVSKWCQQYKDYLERQDG
jgi:hypothetical protein